MPNWSFNSLTLQGSKNDLHKFYSENKSDEIHEGKQVELSFKKAINSLEKIDDLKLVWRKFVNQQLKSKYKKLYNHLNTLLYLKVKNFSLLQRWRLKQEKKLWLKNKKLSNNKIMSKKEVIRFMQTYQRVTQNMIKGAPKYASIILNLNSNHQIKSVIYKK